MGTWTPGPGPTSGDDTYSVPGLVYETVSALGGFDTLHIRNDANAPLNISWGWFFDKTTGEFLRCVTDFATGIVYRDFERIVVDGSASADTVYFNGLRDITLVINGGAGNDVLSGGEERDTFVFSAGVANGADTITNYLPGFDVLDLAGATSISYASYLDLDNDGTANDTRLTYASAGGGGAIALQNVLMGSVGNGAIAGTTDSETLDGRGGSRVLTGGLGRDLYVIDDAGDTVVEQADANQTGSGGTGDVVYALIQNYVLPTDVEDLKFIGTGDFVGVGNASINYITGGAGNDTLDDGGANSGAFSDTLEGGAGDDTYIVRSGADIYEFAGGGVDTVRTGSSYALSPFAEVENLTFTGSGDFVGNGNSLNNVITGGAGNDTLSGGAGSDTLVGGAGNDIYIVYDEGETIVELASQGVDTVRTNVWSFTLAANVENLIYSAAGFYGGWLVGNALANVITGYSTDDFLEGRDGNDTLDGGAGADMLDGGLGVDTLIGGAENDTYVVDSVADVLTEFLNEGSDTVRTTLAAYTLGDNLENLTFIGFGSFSGTGNAAANVITGGAGNDILNGGAGNDTLIGGAGADRFVVDSAVDGTKTLTDFRRTEGDVLSLTRAGWSTWSQVLDAATDYAGGVSVQLSAGSQVRIGGISRADLSSQNILVNGVALNGVVQPPSSPSPTYHPTGDLNGDAYADVAWISNAGALRAWFMDKGHIATVVDGTLLLAGFSPIDRGHDFTGDGVSDLFVRNAAGQVRLVDVIHDSQITMPTIDNSWRIQGVGDFNGDGKNDVAWRHTNGDVSIWVMNNAVVSDSVAMPKVDNNWKLQGVGDFNGDGKADVLWRHISGQVVFWQMDGATIKDNKPLQGQVDLSWHVAGMGDFDGDGKTDIVWRHNSGFVSLWTMDGYNIATNTAIADVNNAWKLEAIGDYSGDGRADLLWRNNDFVAMWQMTGSHIDANTPVGTINSSWSILGGAGTGGDIV